MENNDMKKIHLLLPAAGFLLVSFFSVKVSGQVLIRPIQPLRFTLDTMAIRLPLQRSLPPDHMTCLIPDLARVEKMPVRHLSNDNPIDRMPNTCLTTNDKDKKR
jgi:hypothetical protein